MEDVINSLEGECVMKIILTSIITDISSRLGVLLALKLSAHTYILTEASILLDEIYSRSEIQNKQLYRNALDKSSTI